MKIGPKLMKKLCLLGTSAL